MAYPAGITLRTVKVGGATALESGEPLTISVRFAASRPLIWGATGWRFPSVAYEVKGAVGNEISVDLPITNQAGWRTNSNQVIDVSAAGSYTHTYTATVTTMANGRVVSQDVIGPFALPADDLSPVDLDLTLPATTVAGSVVQVPDAWDARVAAAEAAAVAAASTAVNASSWVNGVGPVALPSGLPALPCQFTRGSDGAVTHNMNFSPYQTAPLELWVSNAGSDATGTGSQGAPYRSMMKAWDVALAATGDVAIKCADSFIVRDYSSIGTARTVTDRRISVIGTGAQPLMLASASAALTWTDDAGAWRATRSACWAVYSTAVDANGIPVPTPAATSLSNCQATPNSWWTDGTSVWINTGGAAPTTSTHHVCLQVTLFDVTLLGTATLYLENLTFLEGGQSDQVIIRGSATSQGTLIAKGCRFVGGNRRPVTGQFSNALAVNDIGRALLFDCIAAHGCRDGFNYHYAAVAAGDRRSRLVVEYRCLSYGHGAFDTNDINNATTAHEGVSVVRVGCEGYGTTGPVLADVNGCLSVAVDCWMHDAAAATYNLYHFAGATGEAWLYNCRAGGVGSMDLNTVDLSGGVNIVGRWRGHRINAPLVRWLD